MTSNADIAPGHRGTAQQATALVLGGTGTTGRRVAARLSALGRGVRIGSRAGTPPFEWGDPRTWPPVLDGVRAAYLAYAPDLAFPGADAAVAAFTRRAVEAGVERLVLLSRRGKAGALRAEEAFFAAGPPVGAVVRSSFFAQNFTEGLLAEPIRSGVLELPAGGAAEPFIDADDLADVAVAALTGPRGDHAGAVHEVTGPHLLTFAEAVGIVSRTTGRTVDYRAAAPREFRDGLLAAGMPAAEAEGLTALFTEVLDGRNARLAGGVQAVLGRPPRSFSDVLRQAADQG